MLCRMRLKFAAMIRWGREWRHPTNMEQGTRLLSSSLFFQKKNVASLSIRRFAKTVFLFYFFFPYNKFFLHLMMMTFWLFMRLNPCIARSHSLPSPSHSSTTQQRHVMYTKGRFFLLDGSVFCTRHIHSERDKQKISVEMMMICVVKSVWGR